MRTVLANGCFDLLHPGHVAHLEEAALMGDRLFVGLTMDANVGKDGRPIQTWDERARMLRSLACVSAVFACVSGADAVRQVMPNVYAKGADYEKGLTQEEYDICDFFGTIIRFTKATKLSTSELIERVRTCTI